MEQLKNEAADYCCLCFKEIGQSQSYRFQDEILFDANNRKDITAILSTILGNQVLQEMAGDTLCYKCTGLAVSSYKFIKMCHNNTNQLNNILLTFHTTIDNDIQKLENFKSLFLVVNDNITPYYDKKHVTRGKSLKRLHQLLRRSKKEETQNSNFIMDLEYEDYDSVTVPNAKCTKAMHKNKLRSIQLSQLLHDPDNLNNIKCKTCSKMYPTLWNLKQHYFRVHAPKKFKCPECDRSFGTALLMERHKKASHCVVVCSQCGKTYTNTYSLNHHEKSHNSKLVCQKCGKAYKGKKSFYNHIELNLCQKMRKSNAEATFTCNYCQKKYSKKTALSIHIQLEHENGKALVCEWCSKKFSSMSRLNDHIIKHTKQKNFTCETCGGKFVSKMSLLYHTRIHTGERPYPCEHCDLRFLSASRRLEHVRRHHTAPSIECEVCHSKFRRPTGLLHHKKKHCNSRSISFLNSEHMN